MVMYKHNSYEEKLGLHSFTSQNILREVERESGSRGKKGKLERELGVWRVKELNWSLS